ncbi:MAG: disulfide bond formation protein B [Hyphomicrobiaceae bacterium]
MTATATAPKFAADADRLVTLAFAISVGVIAAALVFEHVGGYKPCPLCLQERYAYYFAIPAALLALFLLRAGRAGLAALLMALVALAYLVNFGLGGYHAGVEWGWWPGPTSCAGGTDGLTTSAGGLLGAIEKADVVRCDKAEWRMLGLSFAGWNALISLLLTYISVSAALKLRSA